MNRENVYLIEISTTIIIIFLINYFIFPKNLGFLNLQLHPYLFLIILIATRYGLKQGLNTGIACAFIYIGFVYYKEKHYSLRLLFEFTTYFQPVLFIITGSFIGEIREKYKQKNIYLSNQLTEYKKNYKTALDNIRILKTNNTALERRIVGNFSTFSVLYEASKGLDVLDIDELFKSLKQILQKYLKFNEFAVYQLKKNKYKYVCGLLKKEKKDIIQTSELSVITKLALNKRETITIKDFIDSANQSKNDILISGPIISDENKILGFIEIYDISFLDFNPNTINLFNMILNWISKSLKNIQQYKIEKSKSFIDEILNIYTYEYFKKRFKEEFERSKFYSMPLYLCIFELKRIDEINKKKIITLYNFLNHIFELFLTDIDIITKYKKKYQFSIIFIAKTEEDVIQRINNIKSELNSFEVKPYINSDKLLEYNIQYTSFKLEDKDYNEMVKRIEKKL